MLENKEKIYKQILADLDGTARDFMNKLGKSNKLN